MTQDTFVHLLRNKAAELQHQLAFLYLGDANSIDDQLTYANLDVRARLVAAALQRIGAEGERVLLLCPHGLDFIVAFFGCLYAGAVAVPAYPPRPNRSLARILSIVEDARPHVVLATAAIRASTESLLASEIGASSPHWLTVDDLDATLLDAWRMPEIHADSLAFLQYTSGSTGAPKGVMISHANLLHNEAMIQEAFGHSNRSIGLGWLPMFHDMGLIGKVLQAVYLGTTCYLMSPVAFLQRPWRWLQAISRYRVTTSGAPNFAYDLCVRKFNPEHMADVDLSCWEVAFNGAEPVGAHTLDRFAATFAPYGFRRQALYPCYGLAEATLLVSGGVKGSGPVLAALDRTALQQHRVVSRSPDDPQAQLAVSCGRACGDQQLLIVDPETGLVCPDNRIGEIWLAGCSVALGYWQKSEDSLATFAATLADNGAGPFLRTGDLGFISNHNLFVTGRLKDVIIVRGRNHYPQDIEKVAQHSHPAIQPGAVAAFSAEVAGSERLIVVAEVQLGVRRSVHVAHVVTSVRQAIAQHLELETYQVLVLEPGGIPKTSSGKLQRFACREQYLNNSLKQLSNATTSVDGMPLPTAVSH